ncbi:MULTISPECIES: phospholipase D family protein [Sporosarcina]|uniref:phospholipase D family protein n=1 Tax=Sporosarcina TaxID=1569 RepID=UPI00129BFD7C|nr:MULTISPECIES: phospholipase D family protein [Sporosarcina]GKV63876.1 phospholipase D [Sporosarcina sp. NCCP-2331]GLB54655.1 phospholipase D [Sporosarcina sp. NCCP-2378]
MANRKRKWTKKRIAAYALLLFTLLYAGVMLWQTYKPLPSGISYAGGLHQVEDVEFIYDLSYSKTKSKEDYKSELHIFDEVFQMIEEAEQFVVLDFFLMDDYYDEKEDFPQLADQMTEVLVEKKRSNPDMPIIYITDPLNTGYDSYESRWFKELDKAGVEVVYTDLEPLRDSMPIYSGLYRILFQWIEIDGKAHFPNFLASDAPKVKFTSYLKLLNVKANHRKTVVTDKAALVTSSNPHAASGRHGNVAFKVTGPVQNDILEAEEAVLQYTNEGKLPRAEGLEKQKGPYKVQYLTESKVLDALVKDIERAKTGDRIRMGMFYLSEQQVIRPLEEAANRGVDIEMILDPNENSFGSKKSGLPNRPVVQEIQENTDDKIQVRWYNTVIGQYHTKLVTVQTADQTFITNGSSNLTERTLRDYNLEANLRIVAPADSELTEEINAYFDRLWNNEDALYTVDVEEYQNKLTFFQRGIYALQRWIKMTTY